MPDKLNNCGWEFPTSDISRVDFRGGEFVIFVRDLLKKGVLIKLGLLLRHFAALLKV